MIDKELRGVVCKFKDLWTGKCIKTCCYKPECNQAISGIKKVVLESLGKKKKERWHKSGDSLGSCDEYGCNDERNGYNQLHKKMKSIWG